MRSIRVLVHSIFFIHVSLLLSGCVDWVDDKSDLVKFIAKAKATPVGDIEPLPEFEPYHSFVYEGAAMREPFVALVPAIIDDSQQDLTEDTSELKPDDNREKEYLETFALDALLMVGTIRKQDGGNLWALIKDKNSEIHRVSVGNFMGLDFGKIVSLDERKIELVEIVTNGRGGWMQRPRSLALSEQE